MPIQVQPIIAPRGGLRFDLPADLISDVEMSGGQNVFFEDGLVKKRYGYKQMGTNLPLSGAIMGTDQFYDFAGNQWLFVETTNDLYVWNVANKEWDRVNMDTDDSTTFGYGVFGADKFGGLGDSAFGAKKFGEGFFGYDPTFTGNEGDFFSSDYVRKSTETDPWWICTNGVDPIKAFRGSGYTTLENLISDFPSGVTALLAKHVIEFKDHLLLLDVTEEGNRYPQRVRWSDTADPENFLSGNASYVDLSGADWIQGAVKFKGDYIVVLKERSIWVGYATGESDIFQFDQKIGGDGCSASQTIAVLGDEVIFLGWDDVYAFDGIGYESIAESVRNEIFATLNPEKISRCFAVILEEQKEYWLFVPTGTNDYPDTAWCFNYNLNKWTKHTFNDFITNYGYYELQSSVSFDNLVGSFDSQTWRFDDRTILAASPTTLFGDKDGYVYEYDTTITNEDGEAIDGYFDTKDFNFLSTTERQRIIRKDISWKGTGLDVYYSTDKGDSWHLIKSLGNRITFDRQKLSFRKSCDWIRFRFRNNALGGHFDFNRANIHWTKGGRI